MAPTPIPITIFSLTRFLPRVGLPRNLFLIGSLTAALRLSKGWVRKYLNLVMGIGCSSCIMCIIIIIIINIIIIIIIIIM